MYERAWRDPRPSKFCAKLKVVVFKSHICSYLCVINYKVKQKMPHFLQEPSYFGETEQTPIGELTRNNRQIKFKQVDRTWQLFFMAWQLFIESSIQSLWIVGDTIWKLF